jgi:copper chaperone CopZ
MESALRRRLEGVATIKISIQQQTVEVEFTPGTRAFDEAEFRGAIAEANVEVVWMEVVQGSGIGDQGSVQ